MTEIRNSLPADADQRRCSADATLPRGRRVGLAMLALLALLSLVGYGSTAYAACDMAFALSGSATALGDPILMQWDLELKNNGSDDCVYTYGSPSFISFMSGPTPDFTAENQVYSSASVLEAPASGGGTITAAFSNSTGGGHVTFLGVSPPSTTVIFKPGERLLGRIITGSIERVCGYDFHATASAPDTSTMSQQASIPISCPTPANLVSTKSASASSVTAGSPISWTISVANAGDTFAPSVTVTDTVPAGVTGIAAHGVGWTCSVLGQLVTCTTPGVSGNATTTITISGLAPTSAGPITNTCTGTAPGVSSNSIGCSATTTVSPSADLAITVADVLDPVVVGSPIDYTLTVVNGGPSPASNLTVTDTLPAGTAFVSASGSGWTCSNAGPTVTCTLAILANGATAPGIVLRVTAPGAPGTVTNTASVSATTNDPVSGNNSDSETTTVTASADLVFNKTASSATVNVGDTYTYTISAHNNGPSAAANVRFTDAMSSSLQVLSATGPGWTCSVSGQNVSCSISTLASGATSSVTISVKALASGSVPNTCIGTSDTADPTSNDTCSIIVTVNGSADLSIVKTDAVDPVAVNANIVYSLAVSNAGPSAAANLTVTDTLPAGVTFVSAAGTGWTCSNAGQTLTCTRPSLANGAAAPAITLTATAPAVAGTVTNTASVSSTTNDPALANNSDTETTGVNASADLSITKVDTVDPVLVSSNIVYTLTVANAGPSTAANLTLTDVLRLRSPSSPRVERVGRVRTAPVPSSARGRAWPTVRARLA